MTSQQEAVVRLHEPPKTDPSRFPLNIFPEQLRRYIKAVAASTETPVDAMAFTVLGMLSACAGTHLRVHVKDGYQVWCNDFFALVCGVSFGKTPLFKHAQRPLREIQSELRKRATDAHNDPESDPPRPQVMVSDVSPEALVRVQSDNGGAASMVSAETPLFARLTNLSNVQPIECFLSSYSGEYYQVDRITRAQNEVECARLAIAVATQDKALKAIHQRPELVDRGLISRFTFYLAPDITEADLNDDDTGVEPGLTAYYDALLTRIGLQCRDEMPEFRLSETAALFRQTWRNQFKRRHKLRGGDLHDISQHCSKLEEKVVRWAALLHMLWGTRPTGEISDADLQRALALVDFDIHHYRLALEHITGGPVYFLVQLLKQRLPGWEGETVKVRELKRNVSEFRKAEESVQRKALEELEAEGLIEVETVAPKGGGRPSEMIRVHPWTS